MGHQQPASPVNTEQEWVSFPGGELEGKRPKALCPTCREALRAATLGGASTTGASRNRASSIGQRRSICFQCYRAELERERALQAAGALDTASAERFQFQLPFEPLNRPRLAMLKAERQEQRAATPPPAMRRRQAQIDARHALQQIAAGLRARGLAGADRDRAIFEAVRAAELQLPESWLPFVMAR